VNLLRCANVLLLGAKLVFCSSQRRKSGCECVRAQGGKSQQWSPDVARADMVAGECELREIARATPRRVARSSPPCEYSSADSGPRASFCKLRRTWAGLVVPPPRRKKTYENIMSCPGDFCGYFAPPWDCWTSIG
jgi:hypothetical protein